MCYFGRFNANQWCATSTMRLAKPHPLSNQMKRFARRGPVAAALSGIWWMVSKVASCLKSGAKSMAETFRVGTRIDLAWMQPDNAGSRRSTPRARPVETGMMDKAFLFGSKPGVFGTIYPSPA